MRPDDFESILGATFVKKSADVVLKFSSGKAYDRFQLGAMGIPQLKAARYLHLICQRLSIATANQLAERLDELPKIKGIGHAAFYAALAVLAHEGLTNKATATYADAAINKQHKNPGGKDWDPTPVKFATLKHRKPEKEKRKKSA